MKQLPIFTLALFLIFVVPLGAVESKADDTQNVKKFMEELFEVSRNVNNPKSDSNPNRKKIEAALDWDRVAQDCLGGGRWKAQPPANRKAFSDLLKQVVIKSAYSRLEKFWKDTSYKISKIDLKGDKGVVVSKFFTKGHPKPFLLEYYVYQKAGRWYVYDISYEDIRYSVNINEQIDGYLQEKKTFSSLLDKLRKRLKELDEDARQEASARS